MDPAPGIRIVGGGVAGAALAWLLAREGRAVTLVEAGQARLSGPIETLLPEARRLLERAGLLPLVDAAAEPDGLRHGAIWGGDELVWRDGDARGWLLRRGAFDEALRRAAAAAGARVVAMSGAAAVGADGERLVVATGRAAAGPFVGTADEPPRAVAFVFAGEPAANDRGTAIVEALPHGWVWTHALATGPAHATVVVDADDLRGRDRAAFLEALLRSSRGPAGRLREPVLRTTTDASSRLHTPAPGVLRIGDAAATIDPLSSQGVEKAFAAADHAAAVLRAAAEWPAWWPRLAALHQRWEAGLMHAHRRAAAAVYGREPRFRDERFWRRRQTPLGALPATDPATALVASPTLRAGPVLVRDGAGFVECPGFVDTADGSERSHVGHVPIAPVLALFAAPRSPAAALRAAADEPRLFVLSPAAVAAAIAELAAVGWLSAAASAAGRP